MDWFAGIHSPRRDERALRAVERRAGDPTACWFSDGPVALASANGETPQGRASACVVAGAMHGVERLTRELQLPADCDRETLLLAGFRRWGPHLLERLRGPFALFLWDADQGKGLVGQDPTALSAVFVTEFPAGVAFATEVRDLLQLLPKRPDPDVVTMSHIAASTAAPPGRTLFDGVRRLAGGSCLLLDRERATVLEYWVPEYEGTLRLPEPELTELVREELDGAVARAVGGAPITGVLLSGGLDSSMVACTAARSGIDVRGYSAVFPEHPELDESAYVRSIGSKWGIPLSSRSIPTSGGFLAALEYLDAWKLPVLGIGYLIEQVLTRRMAEDGVVAVIDGQGGDELFVTSMYFPSHLIRRGRLLQSLQAIRSTPSTSEIASRRMLFEIWKQKAFKPAFPLPLLEARRRRRGSPPTAPWLAPSVHHRYAESLDEWRWRRRGRGPLWWQWLADLVLAGPAVVGRSDYLRHRTALAGLRGGSPLLDFDLARLVLRMPPSLAFDPTVDRPLARRAMQGVLPEEIRNRRDKSNLYAFYRDVFAGPDLHWIRHVLRDPDCAVWEFVDRGRLSPLLERVPSAEDTAHALMLGSLHSIAMLECWLRQQQDESAIAQLSDTVVKTNSGNGRAGS